MSRQFLGLGKTKFNSSICLIDDGDLNAPVELLLTERLSRKKNSGLWPEVALTNILPRLHIDNLSIAENRDVHHPKVIEDAQNQLFPFYEFLSKKNLEMFTSQFNSNIQFVSHHLSHAYAALALSPFEKSVILVMDGAGNNVGENEFEECTVFLQDGVNLTPVFKQSIIFKNNLGNRIGSSYEKISEFIFNSPHSSGKVMGLASFGKSFGTQSHTNLQASLDWEQSFKGKSKKDWEILDHKNFEDLAATVQEALENDYDKIIKMIKEKFPQYENLILAGGCALNCTNNARIYYQKLFKKIFVPPFPGDESIGFGVAHFLKYQESPKSWSPISFEKQSAYFGPRESVPNESAIEKEFSNDEFEIVKVQNIIYEAARLLNENKIIAWFQGRSESGPRALGNRSILSRPDIVGLKDHLNKNVKFRESFRPYGCSVLHDKAYLYFDIEEGFDNPYMSYAIKVREGFKSQLKEVSHIDGTSRMQTVRPGQNKKFYELIEEFGHQSGLYCLLNTSLNVMDEPILETVADAKRFMSSAPIDYLVIDNFIIKRRK